MTLVRLFSASEIQEVLQEAVDITEQVNPPSDLRISVFGGALALVGQMREDGRGIAVPHLAPSIKPQ